MECSKHGKQGYGLVCHHLIQENKSLGFWESINSDSTKKYKDGELNAWCDECDKVLIQEGEWNEKSESFAQIQLICTSCYFEIKNKNKLNPNNNG